jgi:FlaA1/EpsC-like NDP-sugar epimerase
VPFLSFKNETDLKKTCFYLNSGNVGNVAQVVVLVTGGCGYVGTHTVLRLLEQNAQVVVVDNLAGVTRGIY